MLESTGSRGDPGAAVGLPPLGAARRLLKAVESLHRSIQLTPTRSATSSPSPSRSPQDGWWEEEVEEDPQRGDAGWSPARSMHRAGGRALGRRSPVPGSRHGGGAPWLAAAENRAPSLVTPEPRHARPWGSWGGTPGEEASSRGYYDDEEAREEEEETFNLLVAGPEGEGQVMRAAGLCPRDPRQRALFVLTCVLLCMAPSIATASMAFASFCALAVAVARPAPRPRNHAW